MQIGWDALILGPLFVNRNSGRRLASPPPSSPFYPTLGSDSPCPSLAAPLGSRITAFPPPMLRWGRGRFHPQTQALLSHHSAGHLRWHPVGVHTHLAWGGCRTRWALRGRDQGQECRRLLATFWTLPLPCSNPSQGSCLLREVIPSPQGTFFNGWRHF